MQNECNVYVSPQQTDLEDFREMLLEADDVADGLLKLIHGAKITKLVMGAAANRYFDFD